MIATPAPSNRITPTQWLLAITVLAAALRLFPIWFGLPYPQARPDEETAMGRAVAMLGGDLNPHFFHWPSLTFYVFAALYSVAGLIRRTLSMEPSLTPLELALIARCFVALAGTATVIVLYRIGRRMADATTGLLAALFLAVAVLHVRDSHFAMTDVLATLLVTLSLALLLRAVDVPLANGERTGRASRWFAAAGFAGGLAASTKYSAAAVIAAMGVAQLVWLRYASMRPWNPRAWIPSVLFVAAFGAGFLLATPYALLDYGTFATDLRYDFTHLSGGHAGVNLGRGWIYHLTRSLPYGAGVTIFLAGIAGIVPMLRHYTRHALILAGFVAAFYGALGSGVTVFFRYILPLVPLVCLAAAIGVRHIAPWLSRRTTLAPSASLALLITLVGGPALVYSAWMDVLLARTDTRVLAGQWIEARIQPEDSLHDAGGNYTRLSFGDTPFHQWEYEPTSRSFGDPMGRTPDWLVLYQSPVRAYTNIPPALRSLAAGNYTLVHMVPGTRGPAGLAVYDLQDAFFLPFSRLDTVVRPGPTILVYRRNDLPPLRE